MDNKQLLFEGEMVKLGDVCGKDSSNYAQKGLGNLNGDYPVFGASGFIKKISEYHQGKEYVAVVKDGAGIGRTMLLPAKSSIIGTMQYLIPKNNILPKYLYYAVKHMHLEKYFSGTTIPHIYFKDYQREQFLLPSKERQEKTIDVLDKIEQLISRRQDQLTTLDTLVKARFVEMFGEPDSNPLGWVTEALEYHLDVVGGYAFKSDGFEDNGIPVLRIGSINSGRFLAANMVYWPDDPALDRYKMYPGDLVMSLTGTVGKDDYGNVCILGADYPVYYLNQRNAKLALKDSLHRAYLASLLKFAPIKRRLTGISRGVRQANIANRDILQLCVPIPPMTLQEQFATFVAQTDKSKAVIQRSLDRLQVLFDSLMQEYFG